MGVPEGEKVELDKVLFIGGDKRTLVGKPVVKGAKVVGTCLGETKGDKVIVFKYKAKVRYRKKKGHRQTYTKILVNEIVKSKRQKHGT